MSRIIWLSNAPWAASGYGEQTAMFVPRLQALGHDMAIAANFGLRSAKFPFSDFPIYPDDGEWGNTSISTFVQDFNADFVLALCDSWVMKPDEWDDNVRMAIWAPVDYYPIPPGVLEVLRHPKVTPIAMSRWGEEGMRTLKLDPLYVPHGVDTRMFKPERENRDQIRDALDVPRDAFLVGMVAANKGNPAFPRKGFPQAFDAFARFAVEHSDAHMYVHTPMEPKQGHGIDLGWLWQSLCINTGCDFDRVRFPPESLWHVGGARQTVADLYQAFDVLLNPSWGEGFGVPIVEAQACGCPVITSNFSAMTELTQAGWLVEGDRFWSANAGAWAFIPFIGSIHDALEKAYAARDDEELRAKGVEFALGYDADVVAVNYWEPVLEKLAERISRPREVAPLNGNSRQVRRALERKKAKA